LGLIIGKGAEEAGAGGPELLFVIHLGMIGDLLEIAKGGEGGPGGVEFEDAALVMETFARESELFPGQGDIFAFDGVIFMIGEPAREGCKCF
jgi:hypothetical protein